MRSAADYLSLHLLRKVAIRYRLIGSLLLLSLLPLLIAGYIGYAESTSAITERTRVFSTEVVKQVAKNIQLDMAKMEADSSSLVLSERVQRALAHYASGDKIEKTSARAELTRVLLERYGAFDFISQKYFLDQNNRILDSQVFAPLGRGVVHFVEHAPTRAGRASWGVYDNADGQKSMVLLRPIHDKDSRQLIGSLFLGLRAAHFSAIFDDVSLGSGTDIFILDALGGAVVANTPAASDSGGAAQPEPALLDEIRRSSARNERTGFAGYDAQAGTRYLAAYAPIPGTSWFVVSTVPEAKLTIEAQSVRDQSALIGFLCFVISTVLALILARSIAQPLEALVRSMRETESGNYATRMTPEGSDELTLLARQFNAMASKVDQHYVQLEERVAERTAELAEANRKLAELSLTDSLTGIANRRRFDQVLAVELQRAARAKAPLALLVLDVDFFKSYNDCYGRPEGDACLRQVAQLLQSQVRRAGDLGARYDGDEFALIASDTGPDSALALAESLRAAVEALRLPHPGSPLGAITVSIGVAALVPDEDFSVGMLVRMADQAMYRAREQGRNQVVLAGRKAAA